MPTNPPILTCCDEELARRYPKVMDLWTHVHGPSAQRERHVEATLRYVSEIVVRRKFLPVGFEWEIVGRVMSRDPGE